MLGGHYVSIFFVPRSFLMLARDIHTARVLAHLLVDDDINPYPTLRCSLKHSIESVLLILCRWSSKVQLRREICYPLSARSSKNTIQEAHLHPKIQIDSLAPSSALETA